MKSNTTTTTTIEEIIRKNSKGKSLYKLALELGYAPKVMYDVLKGRKTSRRLIFKIAEYLQVPHLIYEYEKYLKSRRRRTAGKGLPAPKSKNSQEVQRNDALTERN